MNNYQTFVLSPSFSFKHAISRGDFVLSDDVKNQVEVIWDREKQRNKQLFNGKVLSLIEFTEEGLLAEMVEYKLFLAYIKEPSLRKQLNIKPLSLSCITRSSKSVLFGRRSNTVMQYPHWYELAPSGGIDEGAMVGERGERIEIIGQALRELEEETRYVAKDVEEVVPFALVYDAGTGIYEVCVEIVMTETEDYLGKIKPTPEYDSLTWIPNIDLPVFIQQYSSSIVPLSLHLLNLKLNRT